MTRKVFTNLTRSPEMPLPDEVLPRQRPHMRPLLGTGNQSASPVGAIGRSLDAVAQRSARAQEVERQLAEGAAVVELDPKLIDPSFISDRMACSPEAEESLIEAIREQGQLVPILVRLHPTAEGRYQVAYGHRRLKAAISLERRVRAVVRQLTDEQLVIAQGIENTSRQDLTWIEKALFAWRLELANIKAKDIRAALSVDDADLARFRTVCRTISPDIIELIGRAPHIGRPRWMTAVKIAAGRPQALAEAAKTLVAAKDLTSDERFGVFVEALSPPFVEKHIPEIKTASGRPFGSIIAKGREVRLKLAEQNADRFAHFLEGEMPQLIEKFLASQDAENNP